MTSGPALLSGPAPSSGAESLVAHAARLGALPAAGTELIDMLERSELRGRGGAGFPAAVKWRAVAAQRGGRPAILVNGGEGEPLSRKDRTLMEARPHLVLDGAALAARALAADDVVLYIGAEHHVALRAMQVALGERPAQERDRTRVITAPPGYVSGEESAAVHFVNDGIALPASIPPRPFERGIGGRPTLVQNVETLAHAALIARFGDAWYRSIGVAGAAGTVLVTVTGVVGAPGVLEVAQGSTVTQVVDAAGGLSEDAGAVLLGGYFGSWVAPQNAWGLTLDAAALRESGRSLGCGVVAIMPASSCGVVQTSQVLSYLAHASARQCGPCTFGLRAISAAALRIASLGHTDDDLRHIERWAGLLPGRGACRHPDGAAGFLRSALRVFAAEYATHARGRRCSIGVPVAVGA